MEMFLTLPLQCNKTAIEGSCSMILLKFLSLGVETMNKTLRTLKKPHFEAAVRQLHLLQRGQNGGGGGGVETQF